MASIINAATSGGLISTADTSGILQLQTAGTTAVTVDASQNVGIGTASPTRKLTISGTGAFSSTAAPSIRLDDTASSRFAIIDVDSSQNLNFWNSDAGSGSTRFYRGSGSGTLSMSIDGSGNLGLGVTPSTWSTGSALEINAKGNAIWGVGSSNINVLSNAYYNGGFLYASTGAASNYQQASGEHKWLTVASGTINTAITFTEIMRAIPVNTNNIGNGLLIGTTAFTQAGSVTKVVVADNLSTAYGLGIVATNSGQSYLAQFVVNSTGVGGITSNGTTTAYNTTSDYRLKNVTGSLTGYKERLMSLQPKQGTWKSNGSEFRGFLAHEFAEPYSESVTGEKDAVDANGKPKMQSMQASSSEVIADLVAHIQNLETRLAALEGN